MPLPGNSFLGGRAAGGLAWFLLLLLWAPLTCPAAADPADELTIGEAYYMAGDLSGAAESLSVAAGSEDPSQACRALYLLGRISLLTGDFRLAKEYFERSAEIASEAPRGGLTALAGIGDTMYASGRYEEAIRRYRLALSGSRQVRDDAVLDMKIALCLYSLGREAEAMEQMRAALEKIPVLSGWVGREEEFYHSMVMAAGGAPEETASERIFLVAGPIEGDFKVHEIVGPDIPVRENRRGSRTYLEFGPLTDPVQAMILSEKIRQRYPVPVKTIKK